LQAGSSEVKDDAWARDGWDGDIQAAKVAEAQQDTAEKESDKDGIKHGDSETAAKSDHSDGEVCSVRPANSENP